MVRPSWKKNNAIVSIDAADINTDAPCFIINDFATKRLPADSNYLSDSKSSWHPVRP